MQFINGTCQMNTILGVKINRCPYTPKFHRCECLELSLQISQNRSIDTTLKVGIFLHVFIKRGESCWQPPKSCNFKNVISYKLNVLFRLLFTTTNYERIECYLFKFLGLDIKSCK